MRGKKDTKYTTAFVEYVLQNGDLNVNIVCGVVDLWTYWIDPIIYMDDSYT